MFSLVPWRGIERALGGRTSNPVAQMRREMESLMEPVFESWPVLLPEFEPERFWGVTSEENEREMVVRFELPGFAIGEVTVHVAGNMLTVEAVHPAPEGKEGEGRRVRRVMTLPGNLELEKVEAFYRNGVLEVHVPWAPAAQGRKIEVKV